MTDYVFPLDASKISWDTKIKPKWDVTSFWSVGQVRKALVQQEHPGWTFDISFPKLDEYQKDTLLGFHAQCKGSLHPFFYKDYEHYAVLGKTLQQGTDGKYQAVIPYADYEEPASRIDHVVMWVDGVKSDAFTVEGGKITTTASGTDIKFDYEYYFKVIFPDSITVTQLHFDWYKVSLQLEVVQ